ncbi:hypothetical protein EDEG_01437 [Edhazardia aedis USNM 41457]|uniref:Uncharacterized protein n=1 Tax=Edhazardia aedis (strain USNM 41457) TaxID=1003232 RepID=J8ZXA0_EDHAE|nr:hypothetical protein EDEG_01437 [Edhazardia aedis USNM 41457]|eukprot:EJW04313.1 hypothetical protein EDEG_01437 [Edhazardia aedis USNM 41457]
MYTNKLSKIFCFIAHIRILPPHIKISLIGTIEGFLNFITCFSRIWSRNKPFVMSNVRNVKNEKSNKAQKDSVNSINEEIRKNRGQKGGNKIRSEDDTSNVNILENGKNKENPLVIVTGGTRGIGLQIVNILVENNFRVHILSRSIREMEKIRHKNRVMIRYSYLDLSKIKNINSTVKNIVKEYQEADEDFNLKYVICNAGVYYRNTWFIDDVESNLMVNHVGHHCLVQCLLNYQPEKVLFVSSSAAYSVTNWCYVSSKFTYGVSRDKSINNKNKKINQKIQDSKSITFTKKRDLKIESVSSRFEAFKKTYTSQSDFLMTKYSMSKFANILYCLYLQKNNKKTIFIAAHPGMIPTALFDTTFYGKFLNFFSFVHPFVLYSDKEGAKDILNALFSSENGDLMYVRGKKAEVPRFASIDKAENLMEYTNMVCEENDIKYQNV